MKGELPNEDERRRVIAEHILALRAIIEKLRRASVDGYRQQQLNWHAEQTERHIYEKPGQLVLLLILVGILIGTGYFAVTVWNATGDVAMDTHGWTALILGTVFSLIIGCGLMTLMFRLLLA